MTVLELITKLAMVPNLQAKVEVMPADDAYEVTVVNYYVATDAVTLSDFEY